MSNKINKKILGAKIGNKKDFIFLWESYRFLLLKINKSFEEVYSFLENKEPENFRMFYIFFWEAISSFSFKRQEFFGTHLRKEIIKKFKNYIKIEYLLKDDQIVKDESIIYIMGKSKRNKNRFKKKNIKFLNSLKTLTKFQLRFIHAKFYYNRTRIQAAKALGITEDLAIYGIKSSYKKIRNSYHGMRTSKKRTPFEEKAYFMYRINEG